MGDNAHDLARRLARNAEAVCRHYLSNGRRSGRYWVVGDIMNTPGRSMYVRLAGPEFGKGAAGKWTDASTGEHGDLLDIIGRHHGLTRFPDIAAEAERFLGVPHDHRYPALNGHADVPQQSAGSPESARRLFATSKPITGTIVETYLHGRSITALHEAGSLRFHPRCYYRPNDAPAETRPAMIAAVTDLNGTITGIHRTWLDPSGHGKAPIDTPRRAMGHLLGNGVRIGVVTDVMAAGEGIETMLSLRCALPSMPMVAALSANHLAALLFPATLRRLYIARDHDAAGDAAFDALAQRATAAGIEAVPLLPTLQDFNDDLRHLSLAELRAALRIQLAPDDVARFIGTVENSGPG